MDIKDGLYLKIGDKLVKVASIKDGVPVVETTSEETTNPDGTKDCVVHVPCFQVNLKVNEVKGE